MAVRVRTSRVQLALQRERHAWNPQRGRGTTACHRSYGNRADVGVHPVLPDYRSHGNPRPTPCFDTRTSRPQEQATHSTLRHSSSSRTDSPKGGRDAVAFANRTLKGQIEAAAYDKSNASYTLLDIVNFGPVPAVAGVPVLMYESLLDTETALT